jgi:ATP-binding cassette subfamily C protein CydD
MLGLRLLDGSLVLFPALTVLILAPEYFKAIREFASDYHASLDGRTALASIQKLIDKTEDASLAQSEAQDLEPSAALSITADKLSYSYDEYEALRDVSFEVAGPLKVGVIGVSGAGKSTLIDVLGGFATASEGSLVVGGAELTKDKLASWQNHLAYLPQDPYIFHATLRENISFYTPDATDEEISRAIQIVGLESLLEELPEGLDTRIGEGARPLSGGQAQRVALARICLDKKRQLLLFDEPTAHLDIETELELKERMLPLMEGKLVFFATHRLHWMQNMDLILVMEEGRVVESGSFDELKCNSSSFASLVSKLRGGAV